MSVHTTAVSLLLLTAGAAPPPGRRPAPPAPPRGRANRTLPPRRDEGARRPVPRRRQNAPGVGGPQAAPAPRVPRHAGPVAVTREDPAQADDHRHAGARRR